MAEEKIDIVFAEDSPVQGVVLKRILLEEGYNVHWAKNGRQGLEFVNKVHPSLVISDIEMPDMNGFQLCEAIKNDPNLKKIPVIICSSLSGPEDILKGIEVGADGYVTKPYDKRFLMYRVKALLENPIRLENTNELEPIEINYAGKKYSIVADSRHILNMLLSTYENTLKQNNELFQAQLEVRQQKRQLETSYQESERLLLNILPKKVAKELKDKGNVEPVSFSSVTVVFTDFKGFTMIAETMTPKELVTQLDICFSHFDSVTEHFGLEKLKTIGDAYMCAGGIPEPNYTHPIDCVRVAIEIQNFMNTMKEIKQRTNTPFWELRLGMHTGPLVAGVIGTKKFVYDVWGDTVNTASRMESSGAPGRINISDSTYELVKDFFECEYRGKIPAKNKGEIEMYFVIGIKPELSINGEGKYPNEKFEELYEKIQQAV
ncbi:MAG: response regulator [Leptospiraceae bacterium]|nr:response regulator [Leptospiraceae bacterium]MCP5497983.1 response regulator [Leptospiraceae bacterium]